METWQKREDSKATLYISCMVFFTVHVCATMERSLLVLVSYHNSILG